MVDDAEEVADLEIARRWRYWMAGGVLLAACAAPKLPCVGFGETLVTVEYPDGAVDSLCVRLE